MKFRCSREMLSWCWVEKMVSHVGAQRVGSMGWVLKQRPGSRALEWGLIQVGGFQGYRQGSPALELTPYMS